MLSLLWGLLRKSARNEPSTLGHSLEGPGLARSGSENIWFWPHTKCVQSVYKGSDLIQSGPSGATLGQQRRGVTSLFPLDGHGNPLSVPLKSTSFSWQSWPICRCTGCPRQQTAGKPIDRYAQRSETEPQRQTGTRLWLFTRVHIPVFPLVLGGPRGLIWKACLMALK